jgi:hypothetical protein
MKSLLIYLGSLLMIPLQVKCQSHSPSSSISNHSGNIVHYIYLGPNVYMDTLWNEHVRPDSILVYFYSIRGKYPESSETIKEKASIFLKNSGHIYSGSGYVTFRFFIDSTGHMLKRIQLFQTDEFYKNYVFEETLISDLYTFLRTMQSWKPAPSLPGIPRYYVSLISFKIHEGSLVNIIP